MRITDNVNGRSIFMGVDATGKLKVRASVAGAGCSAGTFTPFKMIFDDYGWTATTLSLSTGTQRYLIGIAETLISSGVATGVGKSTELFDFVVGGPTFIGSTCAAGTTGQGLLLTTGATVISARGATYNGQAAEFAVFRKWYDSTGQATSTSPVVSTAVTQLTGSGISTGVQAIMLTGLMQVVTS